MLFQISDIEYYISEDFGYKKNRLNS